MIDLAYGKPATQSSKLPDNPRSLEDSAAEANAINADINTDFHTNAEWFPWWQVDLENQCCIMAIELLNTKFWPVRSRSFSILISKDGYEWKSIFSKTDHSVLPETKPYRVNFTRPFIGRYIRIRLDNWDYFHLRQVKVLGEKISNNKILLPENNILSNITNKCVVFAVNFNESDEFLFDFIDNFLIFTDSNCHIFINYPVDRHIPRDALNISSRVHIFNGETKRYKCGGTLIIGHMESYKKAQEVLKTFDYFCTTATNALFVKKFNLEESIRKLSMGEDAPVGMQREYMIDVDIKNIPTNASWVWDELRNRVDICEYLFDKAKISKVSLNQIEGLFAPPSEWDTLFSRSDIVYKINDIFGIPHKITIALEEYLPVSFMRQFGKGIYTNICHMLWQPSREASVDDVISFRQSLPDHMCIVKWFKRSKDSIPTALVINKWSREFLKTLSYSCDKETTKTKFRNRLISQSISTVLKRKESYEPITKSWRPDFLHGKIQWIFTYDTTGNDRQIIKYPFGNSNVYNEGYPAWVEFGTKGNNIFYEAVLIDNEFTTALKLSSKICKEPVTPNQWGWDITSVIYISCGFSDKAQILRITFDSDFDRVTEQLMDNVRISDGQKSEAWPYIFRENKNGKEYFYFLRPSEYESEIFIGISMYLKVEMFIYIDVGISGWEPAKN
ncbi:discoidin domain-containing protein [Commensalibacter melissae]|uniref:discoidin domain-containing protein n=1 Tax=Commensalibacter melissae TaxID=2070537 RepID=UPI0012D8773D|nr:discoidin domain-containing protein [Commensalibacter melissae]MUG10017.1 hypothetical protein [Commensalibacter melissae]